MGKGNRSPDPCPSPRPNSPSLQRRRPFPPLLVAIFGKLSMADVVGELLPSQAFADRGSRHSDCPCKGSLRIPPL
jgi:hypothetical protein